MSPDQSTLYFYETPHFLIWREVKKQKKKKKLLQAPTVQFGIVRYVCFCTDSTLHYSGNARCGCVSCEKVDNAVMQRLRQ